MKLGLAARDILGTDPIMAHGVEAEPFPLIQFEQGSTRATLKGTGLHLDEGNAHMPAVIRHVDDDA